MARRDGRVVKFSILFRVFFSVFLLCAFVCGFSPSASAYSRIVSLKPNVTEILFALGAGPQVIGVTTYCDRPEEVKTLPKVADYIRAFPEKILHLKPDLILGSTENSSQKEVYFLMELGIPVKLLNFSTIEETQQSIQALGKLLGKEKAATQLTDKMKEELTQLKNAAAAFPKKQVLFVVGYQPLIVAGGDNFFDEATAYLGAVNVAHESKLKYPAYTTELLIRAAPEVIIDLPMGSEKTGTQIQTKAEWWKQFPSIPAVRDKQLFSFDIEKVRAVPSLPEALREIFQLIHPEAPK